MGMAARASSGYKLTHCRVVDATMCPQEWSVPWAPKYLPCDSLIVTFIVTWCFQLRLSGVKEHAALPPPTAPLRGLKVMVDAAMYSLETINIGEDKRSSRVSDSLEVPAVNKKEYAGVH